MCVGEALIKEGLDIHSCCPVQEISSTSLGTTEEEHTHKPLHHHLLYLLKFTGYISLLSKTYSQAAALEFCHFLIGEDGARGKRCTESCLPPLFPVCIPPSLPPQTTPPCRAVALITQLQSVCRWLPYPHTLTQSHRHTHFHAHTHTHTLIGRPRSSRISFYSL